MTLQDKPDLFNTADYKEFLARINQVKADTKPLWGKMSASQMFAHCKEVQEACNGKALKNTPFFVKLFKGFIKKSVLNDKSYPKGSPTHKQYIINDEKEFDIEKEKFLKSLSFFVDTRGSVYHTLFGEMSEKERSWTVYKHHNHHLEQFGV